MGNSIHENVCNSSSNWDVGPCVVFGTPYRDGRQASRILLALQPCMTILIELPEVVVERTIFLHQNYNFLDRNLLVFGETPDIIAQSIARACTHAVGASMAMISMVLVLRLAQLGCGI